MNSIPVPPIQFVRAIPPVKVWFYRLSIAAYPRLFPVWADDNKVVEWGRQGRVVQSRLTRYHR